MIHDADNVNLLECSDITAFIHQANCFRTMGAGIALQIKNKYPEVYAADCKTISGDKSKLGCFTFAKCHDGKIGYNLYSQYNYGYGIKQTNYDAMYDGLTKIETHAIVQGVERIGLPHKIGCKLGGGKWGIVRAIIDEVFITSGLDLYICRYEP